MPVQFQDKDFKLKYLFKALFIDGEIFSQTIDDVSKIDPQRSQFYDLLQKNKPMRSFGIFSVDGELSLVVDLIDGHFQLNRVAIMPEVLPPGPIPLKLIFFRQHQHDMNVSYKVNDQLKADVENVEPTAHRCTYYIGWECELLGKKYKQVLGLT